MPNDNLPHKTLRRVRSFVLREKYMRPQQREAMDQAWPDFGLELNDGMINTHDVFDRIAPLTIEIGFGMGDSLAETAKNFPDINFIGIEVHKPGVAKLMRLLNNQSSTNVKLYRADAIEVLKRCVPDNSVDEICLFFPDPWPKKKHHKRRIVQPDFCQLVRQKLKVGGHFHAATDWENYAEHMLDILETADGFINTAGTGQFTPRPEARPLTKFEQRGHRLGHDTWDLIYCKKQ